MAARLPLPLLLRLAAAMMVRMTVRLLPLLLLPLEVMMRRVVQLLLPRLLRLVTAPHSGSSAVALASLARLAALLEPAPRPTSGTLSAFKPRWDKTGCGQTDPESTR
jgi:hypothetical protein